MYQAAAVCDLNVPTVRQSGETALIYSVFNQALYDLKRGKTSANQRFFAEAEEWVMDIDADGTHSFNNCCEVLRLDAGATRAQLVRSYGLRGRARSAPLRIVAEPERCPHCGGLPYCRGVCRSIYGRAYYKNGCVSPTDEQIEAALGERE